MSTMTRSRPSSILLQPYHPVSPTSSASSISSHTRDVVAPKRIRFAPLPEPDRDELSLDPTTTNQISQPATEACDPDPPSTTEDVLASSSSSSSSSQSTTSTPLIHTQDFTPDSSVGSSLAIQASTLPSKNPITDNSVDANNTATNPAKKTPITLLKRFTTSSSGSSSHTLTPTPSIEFPRKKSISTEEILTLGAVNLFRTTSRETTCSTRSVRDGGWGLGLTRLSNLGGSNTFPPDSFPLSRTQSTQSYKSKSFSLFSTFSSSSSSSSSSDSKKPKAKPTPAGQQQRTSRHKGTRMLNGRVYGGPKKNTNPFANIRDEEPEFVEWGYGGMGSVKGAKSAGVSSNWERLHGGLALGDGDKTQTEVGVGRVGAGIGAGDPDLDDGSGLAWLKRRKEERERKAREQKEEAEKENLDSQTNTPLSSPPSTVESATHAPSTIDVSPLTIIVEECGGTATKADFPTPTPSRYPSELVVPTLSSLQDQSSSSIEEDITNEEGGTSQLHNNATAHEHERVLQAIKVPVRAPHHHRHSSKVGLRKMLGLPLTEDSAVPQIQVVGSPIVVSASTTSGGDTMDASLDPLHTSTAITPIEIDKPATPSSLSSSSTSSGSGSESDDDGGSDDDDGDDEEDEEESQKQNGRRRTGTAAGVEKISRHKE